MKRVFLIHGWEGFPENHWFPWLKGKLEEMNFRVIVPQMPDPETPTIETWIPFLKKAVGKVDSETFFVGHSVGCQTILRYLEQLPPEIKVGGVLLVAGWVNLTPKVTADPESKRVATPWLKTPLDWKRVRLHGDNFTAIFSDDDPFVPIEDAQIFKENLKAKIVITKRKAHFTKKRSIADLPELFDLFKKQAQLN